MKTPVNVLIVEDEGIIALNLKNLVTKMGHHVTGMVSSGEEALVAIEANRIDLLLMDIKLAGKLDGIETARIIKSKLNIPLIFISSNSTASFLERARAVEPHAFLIKPFSEKEIALNIELAIYKGKSEKALKEARNLLHQLNQELEEKVAQRTEGLKELNMLLLEKQNIISSINNTVPTIIFIYSLLENKVTFINHQVFSILGYSENEILGLSFRKGSDNYFDFIRKPSSKNKIILKEDHFEQLIHVKHKQRQKGLKWLLLRFAKFKINANDRVIEVIGSATDVTEQKQNERKFNAMVRLNRMQVKRTEKIRALSLFQGQEEERRRISRDMHDGVGQMLTAIKLNLDNCKAGKGVCNPARELVRDTIMEVRRISNALAPPGLYDFGLDSVIKQLLDQSSKNSEMIIHFDSNIQNVRFSSLIEITLYRIIQESINNALKHSKAKNFELSIHQGNNSLDLIIFDDGIGKRISTVDMKESKSEGHGIKNIKTRANLIGAKLNFISEPDQGFKIELNVPLK